MQELLLINPRKRATRRKSAKTASPAQKRARAKFAAMARARAGTTTHKRRARRRHAAPTVSLLSNPRRRRTHRKHHATHARRRRNPIHGVSIKKPMAIVMPALQGALGAVIVNTVIGKLPIPATLNTGKMKYVTQGAMAILLGMVAQKVGVKGAMAAQMAEGSLTVTLHQAIVDIASGAGMNLSGMGYYLPGVSAGMAVPSRSANPGQMAGMGRYLTGPGANMSMAGMSGSSVPTARGRSFNR